MSEFDDLLRRLDEAHTDEQDFNRETFGEREFDPEESTLYSEAAEAIRNLLAPPEPITYDDIRAGDIIRCDYPSGFSVGVALYKERLYEEDPSRPETFWKMDGMEYLGQSTCSWGQAATYTRLKARQVSPLDERAKEWLRQAEDGER
jgi:hypothetical protein